MTKRRGLIIGSAGALALIAGALLLTASPAAPAQTPPSNLPVVNTISVTAYQLVSQTRISATVFDYTYRVSVRNTGPALIVVSGRASSISTAVTFPDNTATFGDIAAGAPANSTDTITIRQDRTKTFSTSQLTWQFTAAPGEGVPSDPGSANDLTVAGIDSDNDGVRDDVERWIAETYPNSERLRSAATQIGRASQETLLAVTDSDVANAMRDSIAANRCAMATDIATARTLPGLVETAVLNTIQRLRAHDAFSARVDSSMFGNRSDSPNASSCAVDPMTLRN